MPSLEEFFGLPFNEFFDGGNRRGQDRQNERQFLQRGLGAGVVVSDEGHILTNNHVIKDADEIEVRFNGKDNPYKAEIIGTDPKTDLAVIQIDADNLDPVKLGDSGQLQVGEWVVAAGTPFGLSYSIQDSGEGLYCARGPSDKPIEKKGCNCPECPVWMDNGLSGMYYCAGPK